MQLNFILTEKVNKIIAVLPTPVASFWTVFSLEAELNVVPWLSVDDKVVVSPILMNIKK